MESKRSGSIALLAVAAIIVFAHNPAFAGAPTVESLKASAEGGDADAQLELAWAYTNGEGVPKDAAQAAVWCRKAADQGLAEAQNCVGSLYQFGEGVPQDAAEAAKWYQKAADQGNGEASTNLGYLYDLGLGIEQDRQKAVELYRTGAEKGSLNGMLNLGVCYWHGTGVASDLIEAYMWLDLVRFYTQLSPNMKLKWGARGALDDLTKQMTRAQIRAAKGKSKQWDRAHRPKA